MNVGGETMAVTETRLKKWRELDPVAWQQFTDRASRIAMFVKISDILKDKDVLAILQDVLQEEASLWKWGVVQDSLHYKDGLHIYTCDILMREDSLRGEIQARGDSAVDALSKAYLKALEGR